jgi:2-polyprenyl-3-methyl-5-hydroxy-6-metoxy-1,4-benzoquinol methylase
MNCPQCVGIEQVFNEAEANAELGRFRRKGPRKTTRLLIEGVREAGVAGRTLLDVGGGVGAVHLGLLTAGATHALDIDASWAFIRTAREEADQRGLADRVTHRFGNFTEIAAEIPATDVVTLDRVICCYHDVEALLGLSARRASATLGMVFPRDLPRARLMNRLINLRRRLAGSPFRTFIHPRSRIEEIMKSGGLESVFQRRTFFWQVEVFRRARPAAT